jgi:RHS repeat-associated protein
LTAITNGPTVTTLTLNDAGELLQETNAGGVLGGLAVTNGFDGLLRRTTVSFLSPSNVPVTTTYTYDAASRLLGVSDGTNSAVYSYLANSPLVDYIVPVHLGTNVMGRQNTYDHLNRLTGISSALDFNYQYNSAGQRARATQLADGSYWLYGYDALGQVTSGIKYFWDGTPVAGQQFDYAFDTIGNRTGTQTGGDQAGANLRQAAFGNNWLNQITNRGVPGYVDVLGLALATNTVGVNGSNAYRKGEYFWEQLAMGNNSNAVWTTVTVTSGQASTSGNIFVAQNPETFTYDLDGNLTSDGRWTNTWDAENRLVSTTSLAGAPAGSQYSLSFTYDYMGRRIQKIVSTNNGSWVYSYTNRFVYDGWNVVAILDGANKLLYSFIWGTDLSGSMQGAGGVGGAISMTVYGTNAGTYFYCYDANGNVVALVNAANGNVAAQYEYGPFGEVIRATGPMAKVNPFMFQTEFYDWETGKYYVKNRFYDPGTGRFLSRDRLAELAFFQHTHVSIQTDQTANVGDMADYGESLGNGANPTSTSAYYGSSVHIYVFCNNNPVNSFDINGNQWQPIVQQLPAINAEVAAIIEETEEAGPEIITWFEYNGQRFSTWLSALAARGRQIHQVYEDKFPMPLWQREFTIPGGRIDLLSRQLQIIRDLKPNNAAALQKASDQLQRYFQNLPSVNACYKLQVQPYNLIEVPGPITPVIK